MTLGRRQTGGVGAAWRLALGATAWLCLIAAALGLAATASRAMIVTPGVTVGVGYDDNVRLQSPPKSDFFGLVRPSLSLDAGNRANRLTAVGSLDYAHYFKLSEYTRIESGRANVRYHKEFSGATAVDVYNNYTTTYDPADLSETGELVRVSSTQERRTHNTTGVAIQHALDPISRLGAGYQFGYSNSSDELDEEVYMQSGYFSWLQALNPHHHAQLVLKGKYDKWEVSPDIEEGSAEGTWFWLPDLRKTASFTAGASSLRAKDNDAQVNQARDYDLYWASVGFDHRFSPSFQWMVGLGWSYVNGDPGANTAAGSGYPTAQARIIYHGELWDLELYGRSSLDEYDAVGENSGLTKTQAVGLRWRRALAIHWNLTLYADYIRDDYQQDPRQARTSQNRGVADTSRLGTLLTWDIQRDVTLGLDYRFLDRNAENDDDDRQQNRVLLYVDYRWPMLW